MRSPVPEQLITLTRGERWLLEKWASNPEFRRDVSRRARAILACAEGQTNKTVSRKVGIPKNTVATWRSAFVALRLDSVCRIPRGRRPPAVALSEQEVVILRKPAQCARYQGPLTRRARMILACAEGKRDSVVAQETGMHVSDVTKWRSRFLELLLNGLDGSESYSQTYPRSSVIARYSCRVVGPAPEPGPAGKI